MTLAHDQDGSEADEDPQLPTLPGMEDLVSAPAPTSSGANLRPDFDDDSRNAPAVVVGKKPEDDDSSEEPDVLRGRNFGGYELVQKIGQGGMGLVYKARQVSLDRIVAIKILSKALSENSEFIKRFEREAKSIGRINHPNLVAVYDFGRVDGLYYMVTEFVEGTNLAKLINDKLVVPVEEFMPLVIHCLQGLSHVSQHHIVHRDIKPDNILITTESVAKIADFGLAKDVSNDTDLTAVGLAMGTPAYMSPEQCMGRKLDVRSDIYALGVTAYFALTGEKPFTGQSSFEIMTKQREHNPPPPAQLNPRLPKEISQLVMRMIAKVPVDRFKDANDCREAWIDVGQRIGVLQSISRSGEYQFNASEMAKLRESAPDTQAPSTSLPVVSASGLPPQIPPPMPSNHGPGASTPPNSDTGSSGEAPARVPTERHGDRHGERRPTTERRSARLSTAGEPTTCPKCGMLNRAGQTRCQRCETPFGDQPAPDFPALEIEAQRLFDQGHFSAAAERFAKLSDLTDDRRLRAIMRSREREARMQETHGQTSEIIGRSRAMVGRGDLNGGLTLLERHLSGLKDSNSSGVEIEGAVIGEMAALRRRISFKRRLRVLLVAIVLLSGLVGGAWWMWRQGKLGFGSMSATSEAAAAPVVPAAAPIVPAGGLP